MLWMSEFIASYEVYVIFDSSSVFILTLTQLNFAGEFEINAVGLDLYTCITCLV